MKENNNWIEKLWDKHCKLGGYCVKNPSSFEKDVENHISNLLTKKDQEHKAELEMIRQEVISNQQTNLKTESDPDWFQGYGYNQGLQTVSVILERHINK